MTKVGLTDRASAAATDPVRHYRTFLRSKAPASCLRLLGRRLWDIKPQFHVDIFIFVLFNLRQRPILETK
jgi:hypothetical protein